MSIWERLDLLNQVIGVIKTVSKKLEAQEMSSIIDEVEQNLQILPTIQSHIKQRKIDEILKQLKAILS
jgi:hypothetical protein